MSAGHREACPTTTSVLYSILLHISTGIAAMLNPFIDLISTIISLINLVLIIWIILGLLIHFDIVNRSNPLVSRIYATLGQLIEPLLSRIRRVTRTYLPDLNGIDLSPIVLMLLLHFINNALYSWFYTI
jgi:YggT family protein